VLSIDPSISRSQVAVSGGYTASPANMLVGQGARDFAISLHTLYENPGGRDIPPVQIRDSARLRRENACQDFSLALDADRAGEPLLRMTRREMVSEESRPLRMSPAALSTARGKPGAVVPAQLIAERRPA